MPFALRTAPPERSAKNSAVAPCTHQFLVTLTVQTTKIKPTPKPVPASAESTTTPSLMVVTPRDAQHRYRGAVIPSPWPTDEEDTTAA
ncbi:MULTISPECIES: hypothetical protein [unclassified Mycolicibacterium]|uniref:hypothetical protein n=1 Tax=unclassified Mycolicibacterium TaxID=2636767 RepID=UPI001BB414B3|nr:MULTISPECIES: hypothetical protein [unclassified Mycolicibacterium]